MRALAGHTELLRDVRDGAVIIDDASDEEPPSVQSETSISVGHRGLLAGSEGTRQLHSSQEASFCHASRSVTNVMAEYN